MFWDKVAPAYDLFETVYNAKAYRNTGERVAVEIDENDMVLECACGTGAITIPVAKVCRRIYATDMAVGMLRKNKRKCRKFSNIVFRKADIMNLWSPDNRFDKVIAGNVIHLLPDPVGAVKELLRVCKPGGKVIIPTYVNSSKHSSEKAVKVLEKMGASFERQFDTESYKAFFEDSGFTDVEYEIVDGRMPCMIAILTKQ